MSASLGHSALTKRGLTDHMGTIQEKYVNGYKQSKEVSRQRNGQRTGEHGLVTWVRG
jgi:hypothetical protein